MFMKDLYGYDELLVPRIIPSSIAELECYELVAGILRVAISLAVTLGGISLILSLRGIT